ncbi:MAG: hypothetical protein AAFP84_00910, partial [Actinomycetota bacterium]
MTAPAPTPGGNPATPAPRPDQSRRVSRRDRHAGHVVAIVVGCLMLLPGLGIVVGGGDLCDRERAPAGD